LVPHDILHAKGRKGVNLVRAILNHNQRLGQTFHFMDQPYLKRGALMPLLADWTRPAHSLHVVYPPNRHLNARVRVFVDWAVDVFVAFGTPE
jgi:DNA-binding transcriptional LysR family regulator